MSIWIKQELRPEPSTTTPATLIMRRPTRACLSLGMRFARDDRGNVMILFGLMFTVMLLMVGGAVDFGRWLHARTQTWQAMDTAVLAGARALQLKASDPDAAAAVAQRYYTENVSSRAVLSSDSITFTVTDGNSAVSASGGADIDAVFLGIMGIEKLSLFNRSDARLPKSQIGAGGNSNSSVEIALMLDVTGSMQGSKISDLKSAAKNLVDIVVWEDQSKYTSKISLIPFSEAVNVGSSYASSVRGNVPTTITVSSGWYTSSFRLTTCVSERSDVTYAFSDEPPATSYVGAVYTANGSCNPSNAIIPLTSTTSTLKSAIDNFQAYGATAGHIGTAWAWYTLSPKWNGVWPEASQPGAYDDPKVRKIAVLMTDGDYNMQYCNNGVDDSTIYCGTNLGTSTAQAKKLCTAMKSAGITVYAVGFQVSNSSKEFLQQCSSGDGYYYDAFDGTALQQAFMDIALKISSIYLTQ